MPSSVALRPVGVTGAMLVPSGPSSRAASACAAGTCPVKLTRRFSSGEQRAAAVVRLHSSRAMKGWRTVMAKRAGVPLARPSAVLMPAPQTTTTLPPPGKVRRHFTAMMLARARGRA